MAPHFGSLVTIVTVEEKRFGKVCIVCTRACNPHTMPYLLKCAKGASGVCWCVRNFVVERRLDRITENRSFFAPHRSLLHEAVSMLCLYSSINQQVFEL